MRVGKRKGRRCPGTAARNPKENRRQFSLNNWFPL
jgi:hypothetical protein